VPNPPSTGLHQADDARGGRLAAVGGHQDILRFDITESPDGITLSLDGELDLVTLPDLSLALELARTCGVPVTVDCTRLRFADAAALRYLHRARERVQSSGSELTLANPQPVVRRLLELTDSLSLATERGLPGASVPVPAERAAVLRAAVAAAGELAGVSMANAQLADPAAGQLRIVAQLGCSEPFLEFFAVVDDTSTACGSALHSGNSVWVPDVARSPVFSRTAARVILGAGAAAVASVPVRAPGGDLVGVLSAHHDTPFAWPDLTKRHLERLAEVTGRLIGQRTGQPAGRVA